MIGRVGTVLGRYEINIAGMEVGRHHRGEEALMVVNVDDAISDEALDEIRSIPGMESAYRISLPKDLHRGFDALMPVGVPSVASVAMRLIATLGDNALQAETAGLRQELVPTTLYMVCITDPA